MKTILKLEFVPMAGASQKDQTLAGEKRARKAKLRVCLSASLTEMTTVIKDEDSEGCRLVRRHELAKVPQNKNSIEAGHDLTKRSK